MGQRHHRTAGTDQNVLSFARPSMPDSGETALDLVHQAADIFRGIEDRAQQTEARAQALCKSAMDRVKRAELRTEAAERAQRDVVIEAEAKLQDASRALAQAQSRHEATQDRLAAAEFRAQAAEAEVRETRQALVLVEEAIRKRLLCANPEVDGRLNAIA